LGVGGNPPVAAAKKKKNGTEQHKPGKLKKLNADSSRKNREDGLEKSPNAPKRNSGHVTNIAREGQRLAKKKTRWREKGEDNPDREKKHHITQPEACKRKSEGSR